MNSNGEFFFSWIRCCIPVTTLKDFDDFREQAMNKTLLQKFVDEHFDPPGFELVECNPEDWTTFPSSLVKIENYHLRRWALRLHKIWKNLCRKVIFDLKKPTNQRISENIPKMVVRSFTYYQLLTILSCFTNLYLIFEIS